MIFIITLIAITLFILYKIFHNQNNDYDILNIQKKVLENQKKSVDFWSNLPDIRPQKTHNTVKKNKSIQITYEDLLHSQKWYEFREKVIYHKGYCCEWCKTKHNLQVHHKLYYKLPNDIKIEPWCYNMDEVMLLCDKCHKKYHSKYPIKVYRISYRDLVQRKCTY